MRKKKITKQILKDMIEARKNGMTYRQIQDKFNVSNWATINYLRDIKVEDNYDNLEWMKAEKEAKGVLKKKGFKNILDLNLICNNPYWDYYAEKDNQKWLIDVTIDGQKFVVGKVSRMIKGFKCAILYKNEGWKLIQITMNEIK